jgi:hypothetical protein
MKRGIANLILLTLILTSWGTVNAQLDERTEKFRAQKVAFFTERMKLTPNEAEKFWPVYNDYTNRRDKIEEESRMLLRYMVKNLENISDAETEDNLKKYISLQEKSHELFLEYHKKYSAILPPGKVANLYITETQFRTVLLNQIRDVRHDRNPRRF